MYDFAVVGSGVTGYSAAMYAARLGMSCIVIGETDGGKITLTDDVANYPGFAQLTGKDLAEKLKAHALGYSVDTELAKVEDLFRNKQGLFYVITGNKTFLAKSVLIATGMKERELEVPGHSEFRNKGVSYCALCDAPLFKDKVVAVVGGSNSAALSAELVKRYAKKVYIIYRKEKIRAEPARLDEIEKNIARDIHVRVRAVAFFQAVQDADHLLAMHIGLGHRLSIRFRQILRRARLRRSRQW